MLIFQHRSAAVERCLPAESKPEPGITLDRSNFRVEIRHSANPHENENGYLVHFVVAGSASSSYNLLHCTFADNHQLAAMRGQLTVRWTSPDSLFKFAPGNDALHHPSVLRSTRHNADRAAAILHHKGGRCVPRSIHADQRGDSMRKPTGNGGSSRGPLGSEVAGLFVVPKLEELVADPSQVRVLDVHTARVLKTRAIAALNVLNDYDLDIARNAVETHGQRRDRLLNVGEAAKKLGVTLDWLYRHHKYLRFTVRHGRLLRFSEAGIEDYIRRRCS